MSTTFTTIVNAMIGATRPDGPTVDVLVNRLFPEPVAVIAMRDARTFREVDEDGHPVLIITDGVTTVALEGGLPGLSVSMVTASHRLAEAVHDFATSIGARWHLRSRPNSGRHRRNRRRLPPPDPRGNSRSQPMRWMTDTDDR